MKIWLLEANTDAAPWKGYYDMNHAHVVVAGDEHQARAIAAAHAGDEGLRAWLSSEFSSCLEVELDTPRRVISDFRAG